VRGEREEAHTPRRQWRRPPTRPAPLPAPRFSTAWPRWVVRTVTPRWSLPPPLDLLVRLRFLASSPSDPVGPAPPPRFGLLLIQPQCMMDFDHAFSPSWFATPLPRSMRRRNKTSFPRSWFSRGVASVGAPLRFRHGNGPSLLPHLAALEPRSILRVRPF
jgi:hypothetical protein